MSEDKENWESPWVTRSYTLEEKLKVAIEALEQIRKLSFDLSTEQIINKALKKLKE
jgi:hypothetical protein